MHRWLIIFAVMSNLFACQAAYHLKKSDWANGGVLKKEFFVQIDDNQPYRLADIYENHQGLVLIFWQSQCPCVKRYQNRINNIFEKYGEQGMAFMHVSSNTNETFADVKKVYEKRGTSLPLARDEGGVLAQALGVKGTPTAVLLDKDGRVQFLGWIDNERDETEAGRIAYLENAIKEFLANKPITEPTSPMFGCPIL